MKSISNNNYSIFREKMHLKEVHVLREEFAKREKAIIHKYKKVKNRLKRAVTIIELLKRELERQNSCSQIKENHYNGYASINSSTHNLRKKSAGIQR
jgi:hypothetical protein